MIDLTRFWAAPEDSDEDDQPEEPAPGVTPEAIAEWEAEHGVRLPEPLRAALQIQDGGLTRIENDISSVTVHALAEIQPVEDDFWEWHADDDAEDGLMAPDHSLVFEWGNDHGTLLLNYNANGPQGEPSVHTDYHGESLYNLADTVAEYFEQEFAADDEPTLDWAEAEGHTAILAREVLTFDDGEEGRSTREQILARAGDALILFTRDQSDDGERRSRTTLPLPLEAGMTTIQPLRPEPNPTFSLHLYPSDSDGIRSVESATTRDGRWRNSASEGVPVYGSFEATDRARLEALRAELLGAEAAAQAKAGEDEFAAEVARLDALSPLERQAMMLQKMMSLMPADQREALLSGSVDQAVQQVADAAQADGLPPELAEAAMAVRRRLAEALQRFQAPPDAGGIRG